MRQLLEQRWGSDASRPHADGTRKVLSANKSDARTVNGEHPAQSDDDGAVHAGDVVPLYRLGHKGRTTISPTATSVCNKTSKIR